MSFFCTWSENTYCALRSFANGMSFAIAPSVRTPNIADAEGAQWVAHGIGDGRAFEAAMDHAVGALLVLADAVAVPVGRRHQLGERRRVAFAEQIAGLLPAEHGACRHRPRRALVGAVAGEEVHEERRVGEVPGLAVAAALEHVAKEGLGLGAVEKVLLVGRALVGVAGRDGDAVETDRLHLVEERGQARRVGAVEHGAVDLRPKALALGQQDGVARGLEHAFEADRLVVHLLVAVEVDRPGEKGRRRVVVDLLLQQQRVGAEDDELLLRDVALDDARHVAMQQRLAAGDRDDGSAALVDRFHALLVRQALVQDLVGVIDLAAAGARQVAAKQRLEHEHQRVALVALEVLTHDVRADARLLQERNGHDVRERLADGQKPLRPRIVADKRGRQAKLGFFTHAAHGRHLHRRPADAAPRGRPAPAPRAPRRRP